MENFHFTETNFHMIRPECFDLWSSETVENNQAKNRQLVNQRPSIPGQKVS